MLALDRYQLDLKAPLHLGTRGVGLEKTAMTIRSDTLFSALCVGIAATHGAAVVDDLIEWFQNGLPPFLLSSTFPWAGELFLLPRPRLARTTGPAARARWVSWTRFEQLLAADQQTLSADASHVLGDDQVWLAETDLDRVVPVWPWWTESTVARVTLDRVTNASQIYHCSRLSFAPSAGLYFLIEWRERSWQSVFDEAIDYLAEAGLGGERSAGHGQFQVRSVERVQLAEPVDGQTAVTLSLYHPTSAEIAGGALGDGAAYDLELRGGWLAGPADGGLWRRSVRMLAEGAVIRLQVVPAGDLVSVAPVGYRAHPVYRYGIALTARAKAALIEEGERGH